VFEKKIAAASRSSIDAFIFDWYWYTDGPFFESALAGGYLRASNHRDLKFGVMWANHDWFDIHPAKMAGAPTLQCPGVIGAEAFEAMVDRWLELFHTPPTSSSTVAPISPSERRRRGTKPLSATKIL
jgi:hypothetical protein